MRTENIEEAVMNSKEGKDVAFIITSANKYSLFKVCYYEIKHCTRSEFRTIVYNKNKDLLYYMLRFVHIITFGHYNLVYEYDDVDSQ